MDHDVVNADWPYMVRAGCFDVRKPLVVALGYARLLGSDRLGPLTENQNAAVADLRKAVLQIRERVDRLETLSLVESRGLGSATTSFSLREMLSEIVAGRPALQDLGPVQVQAEGPEMVIGHFPLLRDAIDGLVWSIFTRLIDGPMSIRIIDPPWVSERWIVLAALDLIREPIEANLKGLTPLPECVGPLSLDLPFAGRVVRAHGGQLLALPSGIVGAVVALPRPLNDRHGEGDTGST